MGRGQPMAAALRPGGGAPGRGRRREGRGAPAAAGRARRGAVRRGAWGDGGAPLLLRVRGPEGREEPPGGVLLRLRGSGRELREVAAPRPPAPPGPRLPVGGERCGAETLLSRWGLRARPRLTGPPAVSRYPRRGCRPQGRRAGDLTGGWEGEGRAGWAQAAGAGWDGTRQGKGLGCAAALSVLPR